MFGEAEKKDFVNPESWKSEIGESEVRRDEHGDEQDSESHPFSVDNHPAGILPGGIISRLKPGI
jgi:hypothetical protein